MADDTMFARMHQGAGFIAALDQSGGSTPAALRHYGIADDAYAGEDAMFALIEDMRARIITAPSFDRAQVIAAILFERTMDALVHGMPVPAYLWRERGIVPLLKIDRGLDAEADGVRLMKPIPDLDDLLARATALGVFGTKARSVVARASPSGIAAAVVQQLDLAERVSSAGLLPIVELEVLIESPDKAAAEAMLLTELTHRLDDGPVDRRVMLKLTLPEVPDLYVALTRHPSIVRVAALSGGYPRAEACRRLAANMHMIASFSRALTDDLKRSMNDAEFDATLAASMTEIFRASTMKK